MSPLRINKLCAHPGCGAVISVGTYCEPHRKKKQLDYDTTRREQGKFYWSYAWKKLRAQVIKEEPTCRLCGKEPSAEVDHIIPVRERPDMALVRENCRGACKPCHSSRTLSDLNRRRLRR